MSDTTTADSEPAQPLAVPLSDQLGPLPHVPPLPFAVFDEFGRGADDRVHAYAIVHAAAAVAAEHKRMNAVLSAQGVAHHREVQEQVAAERERCAQLCEQTGAYTDELDMALMCAAAIRGA